MRPIILQGHDRAITQVKYNREGDLIFSGAKDNCPSVWYSSNGERVGTFDGHKGSIWCHDVDWKTTRFLSGGGDMTIRLWDVSNGVELNKVERDSPVRTCLFSYSGNVVVYSTDQAMGKPCEIFIADVRDSQQLGESTTRTTVQYSKVTSILWGAVDETVITGHENGKLTLWDLKTNKIVTTAEDHVGSINDMQACKDGTMFITASKDNTAKLFDTETLECLKTYKTDRPVNSACISPNLEHVCLGGGQEAMEVTTSATSQGKFEARFFHLIFEEEFARVKGHFGPINSLAFHPSGTQYTSGAEDGFLRVHNFDSSYFDYKADYYL
jgi:translation initiation factor 3 subunit I